MTSLHYQGIFGQISPKKYRKVFPSYDWDEDVWRVNQIMNLPKIIGREDMGFMKNVPNEEVKKSDAAIQRWIDANLVGCSCLVVFVGEKTYQSRWVKYEIEQARKQGMGRLLISLKDVKNRGLESGRLQLQPQAGERAGSAVCGAFPAGGQAGQGTVHQRQTCAQT